MLTEVCAFLRNWFEYEKVIGPVRIADGIITVRNSAINPATGQYIRIVDSIFNDGIKKYGTDTLTDEEFDGAVWLLKIPPAVVSIAAEIGGWQAKYGAVSSKAMSPFNSESFAGYSYSKSSGGAFGQDGTSSPASWQSQYAARLAPWRKL